MRCPCRCARVQRRFGVEASGGSHTERTPERGGRLPRRQDIPDEAFLTLDDLKQLPAGGNSHECLRIASASHAWQQPDNPDPKGINLALLARFLKILLHGGMFRGVKGVKWKATYGIFFECVLLLTQRSTRAAALPSSL